MRDEQKLNGDNIRKLQNEQKWFRQHEFRLKKKHARILQKKSLKRAEKRKNEIETNNIKP